MPAGAYNLPLEDSRDIQQYDLDLYRRDSSRNLTQYPGSIRQYFDACPTEPLQSNFYEIPGLLALSFAGVTGGTSLLRKA